jgi:hypothetical protein
MPCSYANAMLSHACQQQPFSRLLGFAACFCCLLLLPGPSEGGRRLARGGLEGVGVPLPGPCAGLAPRARVLGVSHHLRVSLRG